jgi:hypothetical protein
MGHHWQTVILFFVALSLSGRPAAAARLIQVSYERDGRVLLETYYEDRGRADVATVWRYLGTRPILAESSQWNLASSGDPLRADLPGKTTIRVRHAGRELASATVSGLTLTRLDPGSAHWYLPKPEVERTARDAGVGPGVRHGGAWLGGVAAGILGLLCLGFWQLARWLLRRRDRDSG